MQHTRRDVLRAGCTVPVIALAGCADVLAVIGEDGSHPYHEYIPQDGANDDEGVYFIHIDASWLREYDDEEELPYADQLPGAVSVDFDPTTPIFDVDPMVGYPAAGLGKAALKVIFGLLPYGFADPVFESFGEEALDDVEASHDGDDVDLDDEADNEIDGSVDVDSILVVDGVVVVRGSFDARTIVAASSEFDPAGERHGFDVYEGARDAFPSTVGKSFAVRDDELIALLDEDSDIDAIIDSAAGEIDRVTDDDDGEWMLQTASADGITVGVWGVEPDDDSENLEFIGTQNLTDDALGFVTSLTLGPEEGVGTFAAPFPQGQVPPESEVWSQIGTSATEREVSIEDNRITVEAVWQSVDEADDE